MGKLNFSKKKKNLFFEREKSLLDDTKEFLINYLKNVNV